MLSDAFSAEGMIMKQWIRILAMLGTGLLALVSIALGVEVELLTLPEGDAIAGRQAFIDLQCVACHKVAGDTLMPEPVSSGPSPVFGVAQSTYKSRFLAQSIISPSHAFAPGFADHKDPLSRMGDFSSSITIQQLSDLVAYLKSIDEEV